MRGTGTLAAGPKVPGPGMTAAAADALAAEPCPAESFCWGVLCPQAGRHRIMYLVESDPERGSGIGWLAGTELGVPGPPVSGIHARPGGKGGDFMRDIAYAVRGFLTVRRDSLRVPLSGSLTLHVEPDSGLFAGDLVLHQATVSRTVLGASLFSATVQIGAESPVIGRVDHEGRIFAAATVDAVIAAAHAAGRRLISGGSCRTATSAVVPLRSKSGFSLERGGRLAGRYHRPPVTGCGWITPLVNLLVAGPGNAVVIDLTPLT